MTEFVASRVLIAPVYIVNEEHLKLKILFMSNYRSNHVLSAQQFVSFLRAPVPLHQV